MSVGNCCVMHVDLSGLSVCLSVIFSVITGVPS